MLISVMNQGQEALQKDAVLELRGEKLPGPRVDFSHGDVDAHVPTPGSFELFAEGVKEGAPMAYTPGVISQYYEWT